MKSSQWAGRIFVALMLVLMVDGQVQAGQAAASLPPNCRFGITSPGGLDGNGPAELQALQVGSYLDWGNKAPSSPKLPVGVDYINVLRVGNRCENNPVQELAGINCSSGQTMWGYTQANLSAILAKAPAGSYWEIGNEPDTTYSIQDGITAKDYADRFYTLATQIRGYDASAKIGFGSVVQPTPIRMRYLNLAWAELVNKAGSATAASALIDSWDVHAFILNELPGQWGTGVPLGFENDHRDAQAITDWSQTYSITLFDQRVQAFRSWMAGKGEQDKPLWITEYGSLLPPINDPGKHFVTVSDALTANFMTSSFNYLLNTTNSQTGMPDDGYHLVQRWFWFSLNNDRTSLGGTLYDPFSNPIDTITPVGTAFVSYKPKQAVAPDYAMDGQPTVSPDASDATKFQLSFNLLDAGNNTAPGGVEIYVYADSPTGTPVATFPTPRMSGCAETRTVTADLPYFSTATGKLYIEADTNGDTNPANNWAEVAAPPVATDLSAIARSTNKIILQWNSGVGGNNSFQVERSPDGSSGWTQVGGLVQNATSTIDQDPNLKPGTTYYYRVRVVNSAGTWGAITPPAFAKTEGTGAPPVPILTQQNISAISNRQIKLMWFNPDDNTHYYVERSKDKSTWSAPIPVQGVDTPDYTTVFIDRGLDINQTYYYQVQSCNSSEKCSSFSTPPVSAKTYPYGIYLPLIQ